MSRPRSPKLKLQPVAEILRVHNLLFTALYTANVELPDDIVGMYEALHWVLGVSNSKAGFATAMAQVEATMRQAEEAMRAPAPKPVASAAAAESTGDQ